MELYPPDSAPLTGDLILAMFDTGQIAPAFWDRTRGEWHTMLYACGGQSGPPEFYPAYRDHFRMDGWLPMPDVPIRHAYSAATGYEEIRNPRGSVRRNHDLDIQTISVPADEV